MILIILIVVLCTAGVLVYFKDMFIVICPKCRSINTSKMIFSSESIKNLIDHQRGFKRLRQVYYVTERYVCRKCGHEFERIARRQDQENGF